MRNRTILLLLSTSVAGAQTSNLVAIISKPVSRTIELPAEIQPYLSVSLHARVPGYVDRVAVGRGGAVKEGELLINLTAPEMEAQIAEGNRNFRRRKPIACEMSSRMPGDMVLRPANDEIREGAPLQTVSAPK